MPRNEIVEFISILLKKNNDSIEFSILLIYSLIILADNPCNLYLALFFNEFTLCWFIPLSSTINLFYYRESATLDTLSVHKTNNKK